MNKNSIANIVLTVSGLAIGGATGYFVAKKRFEKIADEEIESVKEAYKMLRKEDEYSNPETTAAQLAKGKAIVEKLRGAAVETEDIVRYEEKVEELDYSNITGPKGDPGPVESITNVFVTAKNMDPGVVTVPSMDHPYVISYDEFMDPEFDRFSKIDITYFEYDNTLMDEREAIIPDIENTVSTVALTKFGERSMDESMVYVRNEKLETDFEITRDERSYGTVVMGLPDERITKESQDE